MARIYVPMWGTFDRYAGPASSAHLGVFEAGDDGLDDGLDGVNNRVMW